jgi:hypothetical protein
MKTTLQKMVVLLAASALTLSLVPCLVTARGDGFIGQAHCYSYGISCGTCSTGTGIAYCQNPIPSGFNYGECQQGGNGCNFQNNYSCGPSYYCSNDLPTGNSCISGIFICQ